jgi:putative nucleotidyltransferase with HDIG domain
MSNGQTLGVAAHPEALNAIVKAGEKYSIVASRDIVDVRGIKLWAKGLRVTSELHQRLMERRLQRALETCLVAEDGVTMFTLHDELKTFLEGDSSLAQGIRPWAPELLKQIKALPLHSVAQLLLTTGVANRPNTLKHAVQAMALAGAMAARQGTSVDVRLAMLGGLLHDIGEVYIQPNYLDPDGPLDLVGHKHVIAHPRVAHLLLKAHTEYPEALTRAIGEHHERLDGSGYPARLSGEEVSPLGRMLSIVEVAVGHLNGEQAPLTRASFALRVIPGEFDAQWTGLVFDIARNAGETIPISATLPHTLPLEEITRQFQRAQLLENQLKAQARFGPVMDIVALALQRLTRLQIAWNALGLWGTDSAALGPQELFELEMAGNELHDYLRDFQRECLMLSVRLTVSEKLLIESLWEELKL